MGHVRSHSVKTVLVSKRVKFKMNWEQKDKKLELWIRLFLTKGSLDGFSCNDHIPI